MKTSVLAMEVTDFKTNQSLFREDIPGEYVWVNDYGRYNGDERALSQADKTLCQNREQSPPPREQLFIEFCKPIYDQFTGRVKRFYEKH